MYPTTKGHVVKAITKYQLPQTTVLPITTNIPHNIQQQVLQQQQQVLQQQQQQLQILQPPLGPPALPNSDDE